MKGAALQRLESRIDATDSLLCVGLDCALDRLPERFRREPRPQLAFGRWLVDETHAYAAAYKPNLAFYEARGAAGWEELAETMAYLRTVDASVFTIADGKRADIGSTNVGSVTALFDELEFDALTVHPYLGGEALRPFLERQDKACIVLCRTSNPGAGELQDLLVDGVPLWEILAARVRDAWDAAGNCLLVMGATYPEELRRARQICPDMTFLVPGVGAQGGDVASVVSAGLDAYGRGLVINASRSILGSEEPATAARSLRDDIRRSVAATMAARAGSA